jgi:hypothetical protein
MALARKSFQDHITFKLEDAVLRHTNGWIASDLKAFAILAEMLPPVYQSMLRKARSTVEAWKTLKVFFLKQSLHNRVLLCKEFHELVMTSGENLMDHVVRFDDICAKLSAVGEKMGEDYECKQEGHKKAACPRLKSATNSGGGEFVLSATRGAGADQSVWLLDSGASSHMCGERKDFVEFRTLPALFDITVANGQRLQAVGGGSVRLTDRNDAKVKLTVLYCTCQGSTVTGVNLGAHGKRSVGSVQGRSCCSWVGASEVVRIPLVGKLSATSAPEEAANQIVGGQAQPINADGLWHARLGHVSPTKMQLISKLCDGVPPPASGNDGVCGGCIQGKLSTSPFARQSGNEIKTSRPFEILHSDLMGPMKPKSKGGAQYVLTFVDDYSRYVHVYLLSSKAQVFESSTNTR